MSLTTAQTLGSLAIGFGGLALGAWTSWLSIMSASREARVSRLWERRADSYVELLNNTQQADIQEWSAPGSTSWENYLTSDLWGRIMAFGSRDVRNSFTQFATSETQEERKAALAALNRAVIDDLQPQQPSIQNSLRGTSERRSGLRGNRR